MPYDEFIAWLRESWPHPPDHVLARLRHTLDVFDSPHLDPSPKDEDLIVTATGGVYENHRGESITTGLTWGDLRKIREVLEYQELIQRHHPFKYLVIEHSQDPRPVIR